MAFTTKLRLFNNKVFQCSSDELILSGITSFGTARYQSDVSGSFTPRSFTDKGYVTGLTNGLQSDITYLSGQTDLRLLISDFETYSGNTETTISGLRTDVNTVSGQTDTNTSNITSNDNDITYISGVTDTNTNNITSNDNDITYISGVTDTNTSNITSNGNDITYLGSLSGITDVSLTAVTNGLTKVGDHQVKLGGALTENTDINALDTYNLTFTGGLLAYSADYSGSITPRSIPDAAWITGQTGAISANNGLTREGSNIILGGALTGDTEVTGDGTNSLTFGTSSSKMSNFDVDADCLSIGTKYTNTPVELNSNSCNIEMVSCDTLTPYEARLNVDRTAGICLTFDNSSNTIFYAADYSACYNSRSLPDVGYVTGITSTLVTTADFNSYTGDTDIRIDDIETTFVTGATNGLNESNQDVKLGGALIENTDINALGTYDLTFTGGDIKYGADYSGQFEARSIPDAAWVTGQTGAIDANNGLTREGDNIILGGALTGDTEISGTNTLEISSPLIGSSVEYFDFSTTPTLPGTLNEGILYYSANTLTLKREFSGVSTQLGQENVTRVSNVTGSLIENGSVVYFTGAAAGIPTVAKAIANDFTSATQAFGVATHDIADGDEGYITTLGAVRHLDTSSFNAGDVIWLSETTAGGLTNVRPDYPNYSVAIGEVTQIDVSDGIIYVKPFYVPNYTEYGDFTGYTASTEITLNNKLDTSVFNTYTGNTDTKLNSIEDVTNIAITGQTGGLTKVGDHELRLGGTITQNTIIDGSHTLTLAPANRLVLRTTGNNDINIDAQGNGTAIFKAQQGNLSTPDDFTNAVGIFADFDQTSGFVIYDNRSSSKQEGIQYDNDYSSNFTDRSLVDKAYVDAVATGLQAKSAVDVATTQNITLSGLTTVDGVSLSEGDRILVKNQTDASENGIYSATTGNWGRTEDYDFSPSGEIANGDLIPVLSGNSNTSSQFILTTEDPIESGDSLNFSLFSQLLEVSAGNGIAISTAGSTKQIAVDLATNSGLGFNSGNLTVSQNIAGSGLTWNTGVLNVCATDTAINGSEINVKFGAINNLVIDSNDIQTLSANNGITIDSNDNITLGGTLTGDTSINGNGFSNNLEFTDLNSFNLHFNNTSTICDLRVTPVGIQYGGDYSANYTARSLVDKEFVNNQISGDTLTFNNGLTKDGDTISWGGTLTGDTQIIHGNGRICMIDGGTSCVDLKSDCSTVHVENTSMYIRSCQNGSCLGKVNINNTGQVGITTNNASTGITITDNGSGVGAVYAADYSATFIDNSLVSKAYVDSEIDANTSGITSNAITGATNGLTKTGQDVCLGGTLTSNVDINGNGYDLTIISNYLQIGSISEINSSSNSIRMDDSVAGTITFCGGVGVMYLNGGGLAYDSDYSSNYTSRSIPDVAFVTGLTNTISSNSLTGATNGLTKTGQDVKLGGTLTGNTMIDGAYNFNVDVSSINLTGATTIDSTLTLNSVASGSNADDVLTITSGGEVQSISASELGEDNNIYDITSVSNSTVTLDGSEYVVLIDTSSGAVTVNLEATPTTGTAVKIKDKGNALTNNITIDGNGNTIDGSTQATINTDYGALELVFDGREWFSLAFIN